MKLYSYDLCLRDFIKSISIFCLNCFFPFAGNAKDLENLQWAYLGYYPWIWSATSQEWVFAIQPTLTTINFEGSISTQNGTQVDLADILKQRPLTFRLTNQFPTSDVSSNSTFRIYDTDPVTGILAGTPTVPVRCGISISEVENRVTLFCLEWAELPAGQIPQTFSIQFKFKDDHSGDYLIMGMIRLSIGDIIKEFKGTFTLDD